MFFAKRNKTAAPASPFSQALTTLCHRYRPLSPRPTPRASRPTQPDKLKLIGEYKAKIEKELETICGDILNIIDENLLPNSQSNEPKVGGQSKPRSVVRRGGEGRSSVPRTPPDGFFCLFLSIVVS